MNGRIRELAQQAGFQSYITTHEDDVAMFEKFAELIVRECVSTLNEMHMWQSVNHQNYPSAWHDAVDNGIETIKEHFGSAL